MERGELPRQLLLDGRSLVANDDHDGRSIQRQRRPDGKERHGPAAGLVQHLVLSDFIRVPLPAAEHDGGKLLSALDKTFPLRRCPGL